MAERKMGGRHCLQLCGLSGLSFLSLQGFAAAQQKPSPNILWLFSGDHAYQAIGAYGGASGTWN